MNFNPILTPDEEKKIDNLLNELKEFITKIPVSHYTPPTDKSSGAFSFKQGPSGIDSFFYEDYSLQLLEGGHTGKELIKLVKLYCNHIPKTVDIDLWPIFIQEKEEEKEEKRAEFVYNYRNFVGNHMRIPEDIAKSLSRFLATKSFDGTYKYDVLMPYLFRPFRNEKNPTEHDYLVQQDKKCQSFYQTIRVFRNKSLHLEGRQQEERRQSGDDNPLFSPPSPKESDDQQLKYCRERHLSIVAFVLFLFCRFYNELAILLNLKEYEDANLPKKDIDELNSASKQHINVNYINRVHEEAKQNMNQLFKSSSLHTSPNLLEDLPELKLQLSDTENRQEGSDGAETLSEEQSQRRKFVVGPAGCGKTVMMLRMLQRDQPRLTPFYFSLENGEFPRPSSFLNILEYRVLGVELLTMSTTLRDKVIERLHRQLEEGSAVFFIDSLDASPKSLKNILGFIKMYPDCLYILGSQPDMFVGQLKTDLKCSGFVTYHTKLFNDADACKAASLLSRHISGADHSETLIEKVNIACQGAEIGRLPITFMQLIYLFEQGKLFEYKQGKSSNLHRINRSRLNWELTKSIKGNEQLDDDEKESLLEQPNLKAFNNRIQSLEELCLIVNRSFCKNPQDDWRSCILDFPLIASGSDEDIRQFFELLQVVSLNNPTIEREAILLRTLVTVVLLEKGFNLPQEDTLQINVTSDHLLKLSNEQLPSPNPMLRILADAVSLLPDIPPTDRLASSPDEAPIWFRLQPNYIVRQYLSTILTIYQHAKANLDKHREQLKFLFESIARMGHYELTLRLFEPYWLRLWLFHKDDKLPGTTLNGFSFERNPLLRILIEKTVNHDEFLYQMILHKLWIDRWGLSRTNNLWEIFFRDAVFYNMNDDQCERLYKRLTSQLIDTKDLGYYTNYIIVSMDSLSLAASYDITVDRLPGLEVQNRLIEKKGNPIALRLLTSILRQSFQVDATNYKRYNIIVSHLIKYGAPTMQEVKDQFWQFIELMASQKELSEPLMEILDKISIEDIPKEFACKIYDPRIYDFQQRIYKEELRQTTQWKSQQSNLSQISLFRPVSKECSQRVNIQYTFFCQPDNVSFEVATECIDEMPEQKFCRLTDSQGNEFNHWFYVDDVVILGKERPITHIAELIINLPTGASRHHQGKISFDAFPNKAPLKYIHLFQKSGRNLIVIRTQDPDWVQELLQTEIVKTLKSQPQLSWGTYKATLVGINVIKLPENMRFIRMRSVGDSSIKGVNTVALSDIPHKGTIAFYHRKDKEKNPKGLPLKSPSRENQAQSQVINNALYLCNIEKHYVAVNEILNKNNYLVWKGVSPVCVTDTYLINSDTEMSKLPDKVLDVYQKSIGHMYAILKKAKKQKEEKLPPRPNYKQIIAFSYIGKSDNTKTFFKLGILEAPAQVVFYHPICDPYPTAWKNRQYPVELTSVTAHRIEFDDFSVLMIPQVEYPSNAAYYYDPYDRKRLPVNWVECQLNTEENSVHRCLKLDNRLRAVWTESKMISFFESKESKNPLRITFNSLTEVVNTDNANRYHASITPLLIQEWMSLREISDSRINFCQRKQHMHLLIESCCESGIRLPDGLQVEIAYVLSVEDEYNVKLFSLKKIRNKLSYESVSYADLKECETNYYGELPMGIKPGMLIMCTKSHLTILNDRLIQYIRKDAKWGFVHGIVEKLMGTQKVSIVVNHTSVNFIGERLAGNVWMEPGQHVIMFPIINPSNNGCAEAKYIIAVDKNK